MRKLLQKRNTLECGLMDSLLEEEELATRTVQFLKVISTKICAKEEVVSNMQTDLSIKEHSNQT